MQKYSLNCRILAKLSHWEPFISVNMAKSNSSQPVPPPGTRSKGLVETLDHECLIWPDVQDKSLRELIKFLPDYSPGKSTKLDTSFEAAAISAGDTPLKQLTSADATALTIALAHNIQKDASGYEEHYTALMRQVWRHIANTTDAASPVRGQANYTELNQLVGKLDSIIPRETDGKSVKTSAPVNLHMLQDLSVIASCITKVSSHADNKDAREERFLKAARERLKGARIVKNRYTDSNTYTLVFSVPADPKKPLLEHTTEVRKFFIDHDVRVGEIKSNGIMLVVEPEKDSMFDRTLQALAKERKVIR